MGAMIEFVVATQSEKPLFDPLQDIAVTRQLRMQICKVHIYLVGNMAKAKQLLGGEFSQLIAVCHTNGCQHGQ